MLTTNKPPANAGPGSQIASFECIDDDGRFCLVRVTAARADIRGAEGVALVVDSQGRERRIAPVDLDPQSGDDRSAEFLLPSRLLHGGSLALEVGAERLPLPAPELHEATHTSGLSTERALFVQHDQLSDQARRLAQLRGEVRRARERAAVAEEALDDAQGRFELALLAQRQEVQDARRLVTEAEEGRVADAGAVEALEAEVAAARAALERERGVRAEVEGRALETEEAMESIRAELARSRATAATKVAEADAMRRALEDERGMRSDTEVRLTWAEAGLDTRAARIAELEQEAHERAAAVDAERAAEAGRVRALEDELAAGREALERERGVRVQAEGKAIEWEQSTEAVKLELDRSWEAAVAAVADVDAARRLLEEERSGRVDAEARLEEKTARAARLEEELAAAGEARRALEAALAEAQAMVTAEPVTEIEDSDPTVAPEPVMSGTIGARLIALDMALNGTPREETARYLEEALETEDERESLLDELYARRAGV